MDPNNFFCAYYVFQESTYLTLQKVWAVRPVFKTFHVKCVSYRGKYGRQRSVPTTPHAHVRPHELRIFKNRILQTQPHCPSFHLFICSSSQSTFWNVHGSCSHLHFCNFHCRLHIDPRQYIGLICTFNTTCIRDVISALSALLPGSSCFLHSAWRES